MHQALVVKLCFLLTQLLVLPSDFHKRAISINENVKEMGREVNFAVDKKRLISLHISLFVRSVYLLDDYLVQVNEACESFLVLSYFSLFVFVLF